MTLLIAWALERLQPHRLWSRIGRVTGWPERADNRRRGSVSAKVRTPWLRFDYRFVLLGAVLPDLVDKPLAFWIAPELVNHALRSPGHTFLGGMFFTAMVAAAIRAPRRRAVFSLSVALLAHLVMDSMWNTPSVLLWPIYGWAFPEGTVPLSHWLNVHFGTLSSAPLDVAGIVVLFVFAARVVASRSTGDFLRTGNVS